MPSQLGGANVLPLPWIVLWTTVLSSAAKNWSHFGKNYGRNLWRYYANLNYCVLKIYSRFEHFSVNVLFQRGRIALASIDYQCLSVRTFYFFLMLHKTQILRLNVLKRNFLRNVCKLFIYAIFFAYLQKPCKLIFFVRQIYTFFLWNANFFALHFEL